VSKVQDSRIFNVGGGLA